MSEKGHTQTDDHAKTVHGSGSITEVKLVGFDKPMITAISFALSFFAVVLCVWVLIEVGRMEYWLSRNEVFLEQLSTQRINVPPDLLHKEH